MPKKLDELPKSEDKYWGEESEKYISKPISIPICKTHGKRNWTTHIGYVDNHDGTATCKFCPWGFRIPGYMRIFDEHVFDLRSG